MRSAKIAAETNLNDGQAKSHQSSGVRETPEIGDLRNKLIKTNFGTISFVALTKNRFFH
jgi:hypothetical protein